MLIRWNENRVLYIGLVKRYTEAEKAKMDAEELKRSIATVGDLRILTGINEVTDEEWELAKPDVLPMMKRKANEIDPKLRERIALEVVSFEVGSKKVSAFVKLPPSICKKLLAETFSPFTLQKWEQTEVRESVRVDLKKRMEELGVQPVIAEDGEEDLDDEDEPEAPAPKIQAKK
jgi:hypothetical protein